MDQNELSLIDQENTESEPVECLGKTFANHEERHTYFLGLLAEKLKDPEFRKIEGFPNGEDEDILNLSDPPYYTACPNPWLSEFVSFYSKDKGSVKYVEPYAGNLAATARHPIYSFHPYHTKVPPEIIKELIEHYTKPNDIVLDVFCGTGMTGVAARECGRNVIVNDLSPIATFISGVNTTNINIERFSAEIKRIIDESRNKLEWLYFTEEHDKKYEVNYYVWTDVFNCPECAHEFPLFPHGVIHHGNKVQTRKEFPCPSCSASLNVRRIERVINTDGKKKKLAWVNAGSGKNRINREPTNYDIDLSERAKDTLLDSFLWFPEDRVDPTGYSAKLAQLGDKSISNISKFLSDRNLLVFSDLWSRMTEIEEHSIRNAVRSCLTSIFTVISERQGYFGGGGGMSGNLYMPIVRMEKNIYSSLKRKIKKYIDAESSKPINFEGSIVTNQSATNLSQIKDESIDYIYTDPPFGANIIYSEMNLILEGWLKVKSNDCNEAVIDESKNKEFEDYGGLMLKAFKECYRVIKPGGWITIEFHNTQASIWNLIQEAVATSGFVVSQVCRLDKGSTTILADIRPGAVVQDLIISAYKPNGGFEKRFVSENDEEGIWDFVRTHLKYLPTVKKDGDFLVKISERDPRILFDQVVAYFVRNLRNVPISSKEFQDGLFERFSERDGMIFLPEQVAQYDKARITSSQLRQLDIFVDDEASAIEWLRQLLNDKPQTYQNIHPKFINELSGWKKAEEQLELSILLEQNFIKYDGKGQVPPQIHSYLSTNYKELRNHSKDDQFLLQKAKDRWYVPNPEREEDLQKLRERDLLKQFEEYNSHTGRKLKLVRMEAVRCGFKKAWQDRDYATIINVAEKIPQNLLQEDQKLLMWYDQAQTRSGDSF